ncbi:MAG: DUF4271 domain-containing protein [Muribaculaceae bacterium]|nr:DUF4271 domain-containing protein [Muribaculaceae bacterium]
MNQWSSSSAADSITAAPFASSPAVCREYQAPAEKSSLCITTGRIPWTEGLSPDTRATLPGYDSGVLCLLLGMFLLLAYNFRHYSTIAKTFWNDLWSTRRREGTFQVRTTSETGVLLSLVLAACLSEGIIVNSMLPATLPDAIPGGVFTITVTLTSVAVVYYLWQLAAYYSTGAVFTDKASARMWLKGFNASQGLLAALLIIPAMIVLFNPGAAMTVAIIAAILYLMARIIFICKGFRLFYDNFGSLIYFILYLCSLEIVPLVLLYRGGMILTGMVLHS